LITSPAFIVVKAAERFANSTIAPPFDDRLVGHVRLVTFRAASRLRAKPDGFLNFRRVHVDDGNPSAATRHHHGHFPPQSLGGTGVAQSLFV
jgi:hypothetical protein